MNEPLLEVSQITKRFPGVTALKGVDLKVQPGEVLAVIGENGAGKSTLMKILAGLQLPDEGEVRWQGQPVQIPNVQRAMELGISLIHQELNLADNLSVGANIFLGREPTRGGIIQKSAIYDASLEALDMVGLDVSPDTLTSQLTIGKQQLVEIAKALSVESRLLIMDEPTSSLSAHESEKLFAVIRRLREQGVSIVYISHRLGEVQELADRVGVLRDGENAGELESPEEITHRKMVSLMVGRDVSQLFRREPAPIGEVVMEVRQLHTPAWPQESISFELREGEIVGLAGLVGAGRTELLRCLFGVDRSLAGEVIIHGKSIRMTHPWDAISRGMALIPEDRKQQGVVVDMAIPANLSLPGLWKNRRAGVFRDETRERQLTFDMIDRLRIKTPFADQIVRYLSGGNQQKVVIGKWLALSPQILLLDEPTRGIDIGAKHEIYEIMDELARQQVAILFVSSEMEEILGLSDRVLVMHEGRLSGTLERDQLSEESVMNLATGAETAS